MTFKDKIVVYLHNKSIYADNDFQQHMNFIRFHKIDEVDYLESIILKVRKDTINEVISDIMGLLKSSREK